MPATRPPIRYLAVAIAILGVAACGKHEQAAIKPPGILISTTAVGTEAVETLETSVGQIESLVEPEVSAEVAGRVTSVNVEVGDAVRKDAVLAEIDSADYRLRHGSAQAEIGRLKALIEQQERLVARYEALAKGDFFAKNALEDARAQLQALRSQLAAAEAQSGEASRNVARARVLAPVDGGVSARLVNVGDYVAIGAPIVRLSPARLLRVSLPYPESLAGVLKVGQPVRLRSPAAPETVIEAAISEIRPTVGEQNRALLALVDLPNPGGWKAGASIDGEVILDRRAQALSVPETALVLRPAGPTVYVIDGDKARAVVVVPGVYRGGKVEIRSGLEAGARVAVDGAGFLSDGAAVRVQEGGA